MIKYLYVLLVCLSLPVGAQQGMFPGSGLGGPITATAPPLNDNSTRVPNTAWIQTNRAPAVTPETFGGWGDANLIVNGCNTTASSTTVVCPGASFTSADAGIGKEIWIGGAGIAGGALGSIITTVVNSTTIMISPSPASATLSNAYSVYGHDDVIPTQACWNYSAVHRTWCFMDSPNGYLIANANAGNGLQIAVTPVTYNGAMNVVGISQTKGTNLFCEINGDCISIQAGPVQGATMANIAIEVDPTQPSGRGIHLNAQPIPGTGGTGPGGLFNSTFDHVQVDLPALECLWMDAGGGVGYAFNLPNQYINLYNFTCNGPNQLHTANLVKLTGQEAQINFLGGAVNGDDTISITNYPNALVSVHEKTGGLNDAPMAVDMHGWTIEVGMKGLEISQSDTIHYDNGYLERLGTAYIVSNSKGVTLNGNHVANSGTVTAIGDFEIQSTLEMRSNAITNDGSHVPVALAFCNNNSNNIDFTGTITSLGTTNCATSQIGSHTSTLTVPGGNTEFVNGSATTITTINAPGIAPGKTLTLYAASSPGIVLGTGGNINFGGLTAPYTVASGHSVTLTLFDMGPMWVITAVN